MKIGTEKMINLSYEQPSLKKYGTMRQLTEAFNGSGSDFINGIPDDGICHIEFIPPEIKCDTD